MPSRAFTLAGAALAATPAGALWWAEARLLAVADLHLGKSERCARRGGPLLPPYEIAETLDRLEREVARADPAVVVCLGDSFDDLAAQGALTGAETARLSRLMAGRRWIWVAGNHDPGPIAAGGEHVADLALGPLVFRHIADPDAAAGEISGHYHPKVRLRGPARRCFLVDGRRAILPAFGAYTGGLDVAAPVFDPLMGPGALALGPRVVACPRARRAA